MTDSSLHGFKIPSISLLSSDRHLSPVFFEIAVSGCPTTGPILQALFSPPSLFQFFEALTLFQFNGCKSRAKSDGRQEVYGGTISHRASESGRILELSAELQGTT